MNQANYLPYISIYNCMRFLNSTLMRPTPSPQFYKRSYTYEHKAQTILRSISLKPKTWEQIYHPSCSGGRFAPHQGSPTLGLSYTRFVSWCRSYVRDNSTICRKYGNLAIPNNICAFSLLDVWNLNKYLSRRMNGPVKYFKKHKGAYMLKKYDSSRQHSA